jgi:type I restriction enzyme S subunit
VIEERFALRIFECRDFQTYAQSFGNGILAHRAAINWDILKVLRVPVPPRSEQNLILQYLDQETRKIDALVAEQERLIALLKEKRQAVISQAVTKGLNPNAPMKDSGIEWLGQVPAHWTVGPLKLFWSVTDCKHITADFVEEGVPLASIREVQGRNVDLTAAKQTTAEFYELLIEGGREPLAGDLIYSRNATVGQVAQVTDGHPRFALGQDVCLLRKHKAFLSTDFLQLSLQSSSITNQLALLMVGSTFKRINIE